MAPLQIHDNEEERNKRRNLHPVRQRKEAEEGGRSRQFQDRAEAEEEAADQQGEGEHV